MRVYVTHPNAKKIRWGEALLVDLLSELGHEARHIKFNRNAQPTLFSVGPVRNVSELDAPDQWWISLLSHKDWKPLKRLCQSIRANHPKSKIVLGGQSVDLLNSDRAFASGLVDMIMKGDVPTVDICDRVVSSTESFLDVGFHPPPKRLLFIDGYYYVLREVGCAYSCGYCRNGSRPYDALSDGDVLDLIDQMPKRNKTICIASQSGKRSNRLLRGLIDRGIKTRNRIVRPKEALRRLRNGTAYNDHQLNIGIEGASERVRASIQRPLKSSELKEIVSKMPTYQYYMTGIGEDESDVTEFWDVFRASLETGGVFVLTPFMPFDGTPWEKRNIDHASWLLWKDSTKRAIEIMRSVDKKKIRFSYSGNEEKYKSELRLLKQGPF